MPDGIVPVPGVAAALRVRDALDSGGGLHGGVDSTRGPYLTGVVQRVVGPQADGVRLEVALPGGRVVELAAPQSYPPGTLVRVQEIAGSPHGAPLVELRGVLRLPPGALATELTLAGALGTSSDDPLRAGLAGTGEVPSAGRASGSSASAEGGRAGRGSSLGGAPRTHSGARSGVVDAQAATAQAVERVVARALAAEGVPAGPDAIAAVARIVRDEQLSVVSAARAAARLLQAGWPVLPTLVGPGAEAEAHPGTADLEPVLSALRAAHARAGAEAFRAGTPAAHGDPAPASGTGLRVPPLPPELANPGAASKLEWMRSNSTSLPGTPPVSLVVARPALVIESLQQWVGELLRADPVLAAVRAMLADLEDATDLPPALGVRVAQLVGAGRATGAGGAAGDPLPGSVTRGGGGGEAGTLRALLEGLGVEAREQAVALLRGLETQRLREDPVLAELLPLARALHQRAESALYLQLVEWGALDQGASRDVAGVLSGPHGERHAVRLRVRDQRRGRRGPEQELGFELGVESRTLGRVTVSGRLGAAHADGRVLSLRLHAEEDAVHSLMRVALPELEAALRAQGYQPVVAASASPSSADLHRSRSPVAGPGAPSDTESLVPLVAPELRSDEARSIDVRV